MFRGLRASARSQCGIDEKGEVGGQRVTDASARFQPPLPEPGMHAFHAPRLSRMDGFIHRDLSAHPSEPLILKPTPGALRRVAGSPSLRLLPPLRDHTALAG